VRRHEPAERRDAAPAEVRREAEPQPVEALLALQTSAGNHAVTGMLARQPVPTAPKPADTKKAATMTVGLGDEFVIPVDSMQWESETEVGVSFGSDNPATSALMHANASGKQFDTGFASTRALMSRLTDVVVSEFRIAVATGDAAEDVAWMRLAAKAVDHQPVR
jgi:hypothetical protein